MNLGNNRVWDYVGDNFVHRLVQNKGDGKLVEGSSPGKLDVKIIHIYVLCNIIIFIGNRLKFNAKYLKIFCFIRIQIKKLNQFNLNLLIF